VLVSSSNEPTTSDSSYFSDYSDRGHRRLIRQAASSIPFRSGSSATPESPPCHRVWKLGSGIGDVACLFPAFFLVGLTGECAASIATYSIKIAQSRAGEAV